MGDMRLQAVHLDSGDPVTYNEATATAFAAGNLGKIFSVSGNTTNVDSGLQPKTFQIVKLGATAQTSAVGQLVVWSDMDALTVNNTYTIGIAARNVPAGVLNSAALTAGNYVCAQIGGSAPVLMETTQTVAAGDVVIVGDATQGKGMVVAGGTAPPHIPVGVAKTAKNSGSATTVEVLLFPPRIY